jgi:hypothetical protein
MNSDTVELTPPFSWVILARFLSTPGSEKLQIRDLYKDAKSLLSALENS